MGVIAASHPVVVDYGVVVCGCVRFRGHPAAYAVSVRVSALVKSGKSVTSNSRNRASRSLGIFLGSGFGSGTVAVPSRFRFPFGSGQVPVRFRLENSDCLNPTQSDVAGFVRVKVLLIQMAEIVSPTPRDI